LEETAESSSSSVSKSWKPALPAGQLPAYDEALKYIAEDGARCREKLQLLQKRLDNAKEQSEILDLQAKVEDMEAESEVNDPETRWLFQHGQSMLSTPLAVNHAEYTEHSRPLKSCT